jgi:anaerobic magnesium-protoporphyrin IX monomethyl ester cyclase
LDNRSNSKMKIVLVAPPMRMEQVYGDFSEWGSISPPTGLCYIAALLRENGVQVEILDAEALGLGLSETVRRIVAAQPDMVGITCKTLWVDSAGRLADALKRDMPDVCIVAGGNHPTAIPERTLNEFPAFDIVAIGEGEYTFLELLRTLEQGGNLQDVAGLAFRRDQRIIRTAPRGRVLDLDKLPLPAFDLLPELTHYRPPLNSVEKLPAFSLVASRGCPAQCTFCDRSVFGNRVVTHSPEYIVDMVETLRNEHGIRYLLFDDDNLLLNRRHLYRLLDLLEERDLVTPFTCQSRVDTIDEEKLKRLKRADCRMILYGVESGSPQILEAMKKGITTDQVKRAICMTRDAGIKPAGFFILGYPGETEETLQETVDLIRGCDFFDVGVFLFTPLPGSEAYQGIEHFGQYTEDWERTNALDQVVFVPEGLTEEQLMHYSDLCYKACYLRPKQILTAYQRCSTRAHFRAVLQSLRKMIFGHAA